MHQLKADIVQDWTEEDEIRSVDQDEPVDQLAVQHPNSIVTKFLLYVLLPFVSSQYGYEEDPSCKSLGKLFV